MSYNTHFKNEKILEALNYSLRADGKLKTGNVSIGAFNYKGEYFSVYISYDNAPNTEIQFLRKYVLILSEDRLLNEEEIETIKEALFEVDKKRLNNETV